MADHRSEKASAPIHLSAVEEQVKSDLYELRNGEIWFSEETKRKHRQLRISLFRYLIHSRLFVVLTSPFIYGCLIPLALLDLVFSLYQAVCFPVYGIPKPQRRDYIAFDRNKLQYLNALEGMNCMYCSYANG